MTDVREKAWYARRRFWALVALLLLILFVHLLEDPRERALKEATREFQSMQFALARSREDLQKMAQYSWLKPSDSQGTQAFYNRVAILASSHRQEVVRCINRLADPRFVDVLGRAEFDAQLRREHDAYSILLAAIPQSLATDLAKAHARELQQQIRESILLSQPNTR